MAVCPSCAVDVARYAQEASSYGSCPFCAGCAWFIFKLHIKLHIYQILSVLIKQIFIFESRIANHIFSNLFRNTLFASLFQIDFGIARAIWKSTQKKDRGAYSKPYL